MYVTTLVALVARMTSACRHRGMHAAMASMSAKPGDRLQRRGLLADLLSRYRNCICHRISSFSTACARSVPLGLVYIRVVFRFL